MRPIYHFTVRLTLIGSLMAVLVLSAIAAPSNYTVYLPLVVGSGSGAGTMVASYLGGTAADEVNAVAFASDGQLLLAGNWPDATIGGVTPAQQPGGSGAVVRLAADGQGVEAAVRIGNATVRDLEASAAGPVVACGAFGVVVLSPALDNVLWRDTPGNVQRCSIGSTGAVAALIGRTVYHYQADGSGRINWDFEGTGASDLAFDDVKGLIFVTGYSQKASDLKVPYLRGYNLDGTVQWVAYDFTASVIKGANLGANSEGRRVSMGADGKLYFTGKADGGNTVYTRDPQDISRRLTRDEQIKFDRYNDPFQISGAKSLVWYGRFEPESGKLLQAQWLLTRLNDGGGNSIGVHAIAAAADGTIAIAGDAWASMPNRSTMTFAGITLGGYEGGEPYFLIVSPDMRARQLWTGLTATGTTAGSSPVRGIAITDQQVGLGATLKPRTAAPPRGMITINAPQPEPALTSTEEGYYLLMPRP